MALCPRPTRIFTSQHLTLRDDGGGQTVVNPDDQRRSMPYDLFALATIGFPQQGLLALQDRGSFSEHLRMIEQPSGEDKAVWLLLRRFRMVVLLLPPEIEQIAIRPE